MHIEYPTIAETQLALAAGVITGLMWRTYRASRWFWLAQTVLHGALAAVFIANEIYRGWVR